MIMRNYIEKSIFEILRNYGKSYLNFLCLEIRIYEENYYYFRNLIFGFWKNYGNVI
jgi:hypothetical protein